jgi:hypothetical protein
MVKQEYTERHHAFISASFFKKLRDAHGEKGIGVFVHAAQRYAGQRGSRMAQKAIALGMPLNFESYCALGEWDFTESFRKNANADHITVLSLSPDYCYNVFACPWHEQYKAMGLLDGAVLYCKHLDLAIVRGFNPDLEFRVLQTMHETGKCAFELKNANLQEEVKKLKEWVLPFEYHCAHIFHIFSAIVKSILKTEGVLLSTEVLADFAKEYGKNMADRLIIYEHTDFNIISH